MPRTKTGDTPTAGEAFANLQVALRTATPSCVGDARFTQDDSDPAPLQAICHSCPVRPECRTVALVAPTRLYGVAGGLVCRTAGKRPPRVSDPIADHVSKTRDG